MTTGANRRSTGQSIVRVDGSGTFAGTRSQASALADHGLLEVVERHVVAMQFQNGKYRLEDASSLISDATRELVSRWGCELAAYRVDEPHLPPVSICYVQHRRDRVGAVGTACRLGVREAVEHASFEAVMMYTTARHWTRRRPVAAPYRDLVATSLRFDSVVEELDSRLKGSSSAAYDWNRSPEWIAAVTEVFGAEPVLLDMTSFGTSGDAGVWRVSIEGAFSPAHCTRSPWPLG